MQEVTAMAKKRTTAKPKQAAKTQSTKPRSTTGAKQAKRPAAKRRDDETERGDESVGRSKETAGRRQAEVGERRAPIEHYRGERTRAGQTGPQGSLEEETLDREAPYNKTYGR
jgi:hypothetical protein